MTDNPEFLIYQGSGVQHDRVLQLPDPPEWRRFDGEILEPNRHVDNEGLDPRPGAERRARNYRPEPSVIDAVNAALYLRRPLLVTGKPGTGKSSLALSIAWELKLGRVLRWPITSRAQLQQSLYRYDAVGRLQGASLRSVEEDVPLVERAGPYVTLGPLGTALVARERPRVLLIDEFDKGDIDLPNDLLTVLEEGEFTIPELVREAADDPERLATDDGGAAVVQGGRIRCHAFPVVVITSNGERAFPEAFERRCIQVTIPEPSEERLREIVAAQLGAEALERSDELFRAFLDRRNNGLSAPTDRLLNALFLDGTGPSGDEGKRREIAMSLITSGGRGDL